MGKKNSVFIYEYYTWRTCDVFDATIIRYHISTAPRGVSGTECDNFFSTNGPLPPEGAVPPPSTEFSAAAASSLYSTTVTTTGLYIYTYRRAFAHPRAIAAPSNAAADLTAGEHAAAITAFRGLLARVPARQVSAGGDGTLLLLFFFSTLT